MVQLRRKRGQKVVESSDDEGENGSSAPISPQKVENGKTKSTSRETATHQRDIKSSFLAAAHQRKDSVGLQSTAASPTQTPEVTPKKAKTQNTKVSDGNKSKNKNSLYSFFNSATQKQQHVEATQDPVTRPQDEDAIQDDFDEELSAKNNESFTDNASSLVIRKRFREASALRTDELASNGAAPSHKFLKASNGHRVASGPGSSIDQDLRPWTEKYGPENLDELVVHKKKVADVRQWLENVLGKRSQKRLLILKGAAGNGKTTTVSLLSKTLNFEIVEWKNPGLSDADSDNYVSISSRFEDFVGRGRQFGSLELVGHDGLLASNEKSDRHAASAANAHQIIFMEEFPTSITRSTVALQSFRSTVLQYLAANARHGAEIVFNQSGHNEPVTPFVMLISESVLSNAGNSSDNFTAHRLLGQEILTHPSVTVIEFNPVAPTFITRALNIAIQKHGRATGKYVNPGADVIKKISEIGDVRNAVSTLEFFCLQTETSSMPRIPARGSKKRAKSTASKITSATTGENSTSGAALALLSLRESTLGLFHAVGKVVYNKRVSALNDRIESEHAESNAAVDAQHSIQQSEVDVDSLIDETGTDAATFLATIHENYLLSCTPPSAPNDIDATLSHAISALDALSDADLLSASAFHGAGSASYGTTQSPSEGLRQSELSFQVGVRGVLHALPYPVKRIAPSHWPRWDANRMFYPASLKLWRRREELLGLLDMFVARALGGRLLAGVQLARQGGPAARMWPPPRPSELSRVQDDAGRAIREHGDEEDSEVPGHLTPLHLGSGISPRREMLLERLPYISRLVPRSGSAPASAASKLDLARQIEQVTRFTGVAALHDGDAEEDEQDDGPAAAAVRSAGQARKFVSAGDAGTTSSFRSGKEEQEVDVGKLVLSDDDIEDD